MGSAEEDGSVLRDDEDTGEGKSPACFGGGLVVQSGVVEGDVDEDGLVVTAVFRRNAVGEAKPFSYDSAGIGQQGEGESVLLEGEVVLACGLRRDGDEEGPALAKVRNKFAPGFEFGNAVGAPASAEEVDDQRAESEEICGTYGFAGAGVLEGEGRGLRANGEDAVLDAGAEEVGDHLLRDGEALGLNESASVLGDLVELVLERTGVYFSHVFIIAGQVHARRTRRPCDLKLLR